MSRTLLLVLCALPLTAGSIPDSKVVSTVQSKVRKLEPSKADRRFDQIGWVNSLTEATKLSKQCNRPIFLFTHDGDISTGRC
jgi:hypothetical protein